MRKLSLTNKFRELEEKVDVYISEKINEYSSIRELYKREWSSEKKSYVAVLWFVEKVTFDIPISYRPYVKRPYINKRATQTNIDELENYFNVLKENGEIFFMTIRYADETRSKRTMKSGVHLNEIDNDTYSFSEENLSEAIERQNKEYLEKYAPKDGYVACEYCRKQVAIDKVVKHKIIYRSRDKFGKACVVERIGTFCSGECAYNQQCAYEG